jgi:hypothetical protein
MVKIADFLWKCKCGAIHDERLSNGVDNEFIVVHNVFDVPK